MNMLLDGVMHSKTIRHGGRIGPGHAGEEAFYVRNTDPQAAAAYARLGQGLPAVEDFTLSLWVKAPYGGYGGWCSGEEMLPKEAYLPFDAYTPAQRDRCAVLLATCPLFAGQEPGLIVTLSQPRNYATVYFRAEGQPEPAVLWYLRDLQDGRWHHLAVSAERTGRLRAYVDGELKREADISPWARCPVPRTPLTVGADGRGAHGLFEGVISKLDLWPGAMAAEEIRRRYFAGAVAVLVQEIADRGLASCPLYDPRAAHALEASAAKARVRAKMDDAQGVYLALRQEYEDFLQNTVKKPDVKLLLISDAHCDGDEGGRTQALRRGLRWARSLGVEAVLDGGDYSAMGKDFELDSYWRAMGEEWPGRPLFVSLGNHETLERKSGDLVAYHCGHLSQRGLVPEGYRKLYYDGEVCGHHVIVLAQYSDTYAVSGYQGLWSQAGEIKPEQIAFLQDRLDRFCGQGKPVFVIIHNAAKPLMDRQTRGRSPENMVILKGDALYGALAGREDVVLCTGHVHSGFGGGAGFYDMEAGYHVIDTVGFRCNTFGYGIGVNEAPGPHHCGYFIDVFGGTLQIRAADLAAGEWLTAYDQLVQLKG